MRYFLNLFLKTLSTELLGLAALAGLIAGSRNSFIVADVKE
jgi:hypothetical protein